MSVDATINEQDREKVSLLLKHYGDDSLSYYHLQDERQYFFSPSGKSFLSFKTFNRVAVVATDPVGDPSELSMLIASFLQYTQTWKLIPCFIGLSDKCATISQQHNLKLLKIGEEAFLNLETFDKSLLKKKVRRAIKHIEDLGIEIFFYSPQNIPTPIMTQLENISQSWVQNKGGREKGFSMTLKRLPNKSDKDCVLAVAMQHSEVVGYVCFTPAYKSATLSLDQARRKNDAPNGLNEALIIKSAEYFQERGIKRISLNFTTFSNIVEKSVSPKATFYKILEKLYRCHSLRSFNEKFSPNWESRYAAYTTIRHMPLYLLAIFRAER